MNDLKYIKKHYGEDFAHFCSVNFPTILEHQGVLPMVVAKLFYPSKLLLQSIIVSDLQAIIVDIINASAKEYISIPISENFDSKSPEKLLRSKGYILYPECKTEEDIQHFASYYRKEELLCTFNGGRLDTCRVWFAVKENADEIIPATKPQREDEYGTSVISIQFDRQNGNLSIKNRYNHSVRNPDATFGNNLDAIVPGLTHSFIAFYDIVVNVANSTIDNFNNFININGKNYCKNIYFSYGSSYITCTDNNVIIVNDKVFELDKSRFILVDNYIVDMQKNRIYAISMNGIADCMSQNFIDKENDEFIKSIGEIKGIAVTKKNDGKIITITPQHGEDVIICVNQFNQIIAYKNNNVTEIESDFLTYSEHIESLELKKLIKVGNGFVKGSAKVKQVHLPCLQYVGDLFLDCAKDLNKIELPEIIEVGDYFLSENKKIQSISFPKLERVGRSFLKSNDCLTSVNLPSLETVGSNFLQRNRSISSVNFPRLMQITGGFMRSNIMLVNINLPKLNSICSASLQQFKDLDTIENMTQNKLEVYFPGILENNPLRINLLKALLYREGELEI